MGKIDKLIDKLMSGNSDNNFDFDDLRKVIEHFDFKCRNKGTIILYTAVKIFMNDKYSKG